MSASLVLHPAYPKGKDLSDELKYALNKAYDNPHTLEMGEADIKFFLGLSAAGIKDADEVIKAIEKYGSVILKWEY